jgi:glutamate-1-semialdehyde 2,1-aminomutase
MADRKPRSISRSEEAFLQAIKVMPGGVSSPVRAFKAVGGTPLFIKEADGCRITDIDGNEYIDYVGSYGPMIVGHANEQVVAALSKAIGRGTSYGAPTEAEVDLAEEITSALPGMEMIRFVNSGTEAVMSAIRLARAATGREKIVKCIGGYHGHADELLVNAGSGALTHGTPSSPGVPPSATANTLSVHYNDLDHAREAFSQHPRDIACFIVEPVAGNMGLIPPAEGYLQGLRELCDQHGTLLLFDEVMTGFRVAWGGAQVLYNIRPDITTLGKVIGGGLPIGAYAARRELMELVSPAGAMYQAGTLSGNPLATAAGIATLEILKTPFQEMDETRAPTGRDATKRDTPDQPPAQSPYEQLEAQSARLAAGLAQAASAAEIPLAINRVGSMLGLFFTATADEPVTNYAQATACDSKRFADFFHHMLDRGVYLAPSQFEAFFISLAHDDAAIEQTIAAAQGAFQMLVAGSVTAEE